MTDVQIHLALNHFPIAGFIIIVPVFIYALIRKKQDILNIGLILFFIFGIISLLVHNSGEGAEEIVEEIAGISHDTIHEHEEMGEKAFYLSMITSFLSILLLAMRWKIDSSKRWAYIIVLICSIGATALSSYAGKLGGEIRHGEELNAQEAVPSDEHHEHEEHEED